VFVPVNDVALTLKNCTRTGRSRCSTDAILPLFGLTQLYVAVRISCTDKFSSVADGLEMFQLQLVNPANAFVTEHDPELNVTSVGSGTMRRLTSAAGDAEGAVGESWHAPATNMVHRTTAARRLIMLDSIERG